MFQCIFKLFKRKKDIQLARPRNIELEQGTVSLQGFPSDLADALSAHIKSFGQPSIIVSAGALLEEPIKASQHSEEQVKSLPNKAVGVMENPNTKQWEVVTVGFNADTKEATVESVEVAMHRREATMKFKIKADQLRFT